MAVLKLKQVIHEMQLNYPEKIKQYCQDIKSDIISRIEIINNDSNNIILLCCLLDVRVKPFLTRRIMFTREKEEL